MKKLFFETEKDGFYGTYYENPKVQTVRLSDCLEMTPMIIWRSAGQNGFIKMVSMFFVCRRERKITAM